MTIWHIYFENVHKYALSLLSYIDKLKLKLNECVKVVLMDVNHLSYTLMTFMHVDLVQ